MYMNKLKIGIQEIGMVWRVGMVWNVDGNSMECRNGMECGGNGI